MKIITNNHPRDIIYGYDLTEKEREEFDYIDWSDEEGLAEHEFFRYKGQVYDLGEFVRSNAVSDWSSWDGYVSDTYFSGILIKLTDDCEGVIVGRYYS